MDDPQFPGLHIGDDADSGSSLPHLCRSGYYALILAAASPEVEIKYGRRHYDYYDGTLICYGPRAACDAAPVSRLWTVAFHPALFDGMILEKQIEEYTFFHTPPGEALHLSAEERRILTSCVDDIRRELLHGADRYKRTILTRHIVRLLDYTTRFYDRQFITRSTMNATLVREYGLFTDRYLAAGEWTARGPLSAACCAERLGLSETYFDDLLKHELGHTHRCHMQLRRVEIAKRKLRASKEPLCRIVHGLGFPSVQYFSFLFKKITGLTPNEYRYLN